VYAGEGGIDNKCGKGERGGLPKIELTLDICEQNSIFNKKIVTFRQNYGLATITVYVTMGDSSVPEGGVEVLAPPSPFQCVIF